MNSTYRWVFGELQLEKQGIDSVVADVRFFINSKYPLRVGIEGREFHADQLTDGDMRAELERTGELHVDFGFGTPCLSVTRITPPQKQTSL